MVPDGLFLALEVGILADWLADAPQVETILQKLAAIAPHWIYLAAGAGVAIENFFPPIPADTFVVLGAFLSVEGGATGVGIFLVTWSTNTAAALLNYGLARRYGRHFFSTPVGHWLLRPRQLERLAALYNAHGSKIIFASRFLPAFRALVPVFAGISHLAFWRTAIPIVLASAIWYGVLTYAGAIFGRNWRSILDALNNVNLVLLAIAAIVGIAMAVLWWKTRHHPTDAGGGNSADG
jgi:membrane protein DedA with SNARE-associated domain